MKVLLVHRPGAELAGAPLTSILEEMSNQGLSVTLIPVKNVSSVHRGDIVFMYNSAYRVHKEKIDAMKTKVYNVPSCGFGKHKQLPALKAGGVDVPDFHIIGRHSNASVISNELGLPLITKPCFGSGGKGVDLHKDTKSLAIKIKNSKKKIIAQRYVPEASAGDIRALVIDSEVVASLWRTPKAGSVASNFHSGGRPSQYELTPEQRNQAVLAANSVGLSMSGVDIVPTADGPVVFEANSLPDFMHMKEVAGVDPIPALVRSIKRAAEND